MGSGFGIFCVVVGRVLWLNEYWMSFSVILSVVRLKF